MSLKIQGEGINGHWALGIGHWAIQFWILDLRFWIGFESKI